MKLNVLLSCKACRHHVFVRSCLHGIFPSRGSIYGTSCKREISFCIVHSCLLHPPRLGSSLLHIMWSVYFDDFLCLSRSSESKHCVSTLFSLLGWKVFEHKLLDFNAICKVRGVQLDLGLSGAGICFVINTVERVEKLVAEIHEAVKSNLLPWRDGKKLRGRLQFASSQMFGRRFRRLLKVLSNHVTGLVFPFFLHIGCTRSSSFPRLSPSS